MWLQGIVSIFIEKLANRVADEVILFLRKRLRLEELDREASTIKLELRNAESNAEREAVLDKINDLVNNLRNI